MKTFEHYDSEVSKEATRLFYQHRDAARRVNETGNYAQLTAENLHKLHNVSGFATEGETADSKIAQEFGKSSLEDQEEVLQGQSQWVIASIDSATKARRDYAAQLKAAEEHYNTHQAEYYEAAKEWDSIREGSK